MDSNQFFDYTVQTTSLNFSSFDKSFEKITSFSFGELIPVLCEEVLPNSRVKLSIQDRFYFTPVVSVLMSSITAQFHYFFCPNRIISGYWETFITRSQNGQMLSETELNVINAPMYRGNCVSFLGVPADMTCTTDTRNLDMVSLLQQVSHFNFAQLDSLLLNARNTANAYTKVLDDNGIQSTYEYNTFHHCADELSLISYLYDTGNCSIVGSNGVVSNVSNLPYYCSAINLLPLKAYWKIWFDYYRDENLDLLTPANYQHYNLAYLLEDWFKSTDFLNGFKCSIFSSEYLSDSIKLIDVISVLTNMNLLKPAIRSYKKDYFTSALPFQQKGEQVQLSFNVVGGLPVLFSVVNGSSTSDFGFTPTPSSDDIVFNASLPGITGVEQTISATAIANNVPLIDIAQLRAADSFQRALEAMSRVGTRYNEFLLGLFGTAPSDLRLQRPKFLGGLSQRVVTQDIFSSNAPTESSETSFYPLGTRSSMLESAGSSFVFEDEFSEYGFIIGLVSVMPQAYYLQGLNKKFLRANAWDYYSPYLENLSEQPILNEELFLNGVISFGDDGTFSFTPDNVNFNNSHGIESQRSSVFGYQERWSEYKYNPNVIGGNFRTNYQHMHQARIFDSVPGLNRDFIHTPVDGSSLRPFVDQDRGTNPPVWLDIYHELTVNLPMSYHAVPKLN